MPLGGPEIALDCWHGRVDLLRARLEAGADVLQLVRPTRMPPGSFRLNPRAGVTGYDGISLHVACIFARVDCVRALLKTENVEQIDWRRDRDGATPLVALLLRVIDEGVEPFMNPNQMFDTLACVRLLLDAGAALDPVTTEVCEMQPPYFEEDSSYDSEEEEVSGYFCIPDGFAAVDVARMAQTCGPAGRRRRAKAEGAAPAKDAAESAALDHLVRMLEDAARLRYAPATHRRFPRPARRYAARLLRLGLRIRSGALAPVFAHHVLPFLVSRTSRDEAAEALAGDDAPLLRRLLAENAQLQAESARLRGLLEAARDEGAS